VIWVAVVAVVVVLGVVLTWFYRRAQRVQGDLEAMDGGAPPPMFGGTQRKIRRSSSGDG
jgi:hypothetical protein